MKNLMAKRQTAVELFAASILEICPKIILVETKATKFGFYCDFLSPFPLHEEYLRLAEQRMKEKKGSFKRLEMTSSNAREYLAYIKQPIRREAIDLGEQFAPIIQLDGYANLCQEGVVPFDEVGAFSLEGITDGGEIYFHKKKHKVSRVYGYVAENKEAIAQFRKKIFAGKGRDHLVRGVEWNLFFEKEGEICWLPQGIRLRKRLQEILSHAGYEEVAFSEGDFTKYCAFGCKKIFRFIEEHGRLEREFGLKGAGLRLLWEGIDLEKRDLQKSLLHLNDRLDKILPLKGERLEGAGKRVEIFYTSLDGYEIPWEVIETSGEGVRVLVDRLLALVIEQSSSKESLFEALEIEQ